MIFSQECWEKWISKDTNQVWAETQLGTYQPGLPATSWDEPWNSKASVPNFRCLVATLSFCDNFVQFLFSLIWTNHNLGVVGGIHMWDFPGIKSWSASPHVCGFKLIFFVDLLLAQPSHSLIFLQTMESFCWSNPLCGRWLVVQLQFKSLGYETRWSGKMDVLKGSRQSNGKTCLFKYLDNWTYWTTDDGSRWFKLH